MKIKHLKSLLALAIGGALLYGCSGGSDSSTGTASTASSLLTGTFIDAAVSGLGYSTPSVGNATTNENGEFNYLAGEQVSFFVGPINLGSATGQSKMSPLDLLPNLDAESKVVRAMASLLQSLDSDPAAGIQLPGDLTALATKLTAAGINPFDFSTATEADIDTLVSVVQDYVNNDDDPDTNFVSLEDAGVQLATGLLDADIYLMNVSKTPGAHSDKAGIDAISSPNGEVNGLIMSYEDGTGENGEADAWSAISLDNGMTWSRTNLSRSGGKDIKVSNLDFDVSNEGPSMAVEGNYVLVSWVSTYCPGSNPFNVVDNNGDTVSDISPVLDTAVTDPADPTADLFQVAGSQGIVSYSFGNVPYHCVWTTRGVLTDAGRMVWYKPQQLTSGRRDAKLDFPGSLEDVAFGVTWQEDPEGLDPGLGEGPGLGWSGATTHHKTDIWYSYIDWANFEATTADSCDAATDDTCRPTAANRLSVPIRVSDNASCKIDQAGQGEGPLYCGVTTAITADGPVYCAEQVTITDVGTFCKSSYQDEDAATVGYPLDGNTAASRPNLHFAAGEGASGATALLMYEETKGLCREEGTDKGCPNEPWATGKFVIYHHFAYNQPDTVHHGYILSQPVTEEQIYDTVVDGIEPVYNWSLCSDIDINEDGTTENGCYENTRRERFVVNSDPNHEVKLAMVYKQGAFNQGERADIFMRRAVGGFKTSNFTDNVCVSCGSETVSDGTVIEVVWNPEDLLDGSTTNIYDDARSLRAQLDGDRLLVGFAWTKDWLKAVTADPEGYYKDQYNFLVRRSFDAGETWDVPRNTSNLVKSKISVVEPRIATVEDPTQKTFVVTYCTAENKVRIAETDGVPTHAPGLDCFYARTTNDGETYEGESTDEDGNPVFYGLATGDTEQVEPEVFLTPDGNTMHAAWAQNGDMEDEGSDMHNGSDVWYRQIGITDSTTTE
jgi:hypothetical protein